MKTSQTEVSPENLSQLLLTRLQVEYEKQSRRVLTTVYLVRPVLRVPARIVFSQLASEAASAYLRIKVTSSWCDSRERCAPLLPLSRKITHPPATQPPKWAVTDTKGKGEPDNSLTPPPPRPTQLRHSPPRVMTACCLVPGNLSEGCCRIFFSSC